MEGGGWKVGGEGWSGGVRWRMAGGGWRVGCRARGVD